MITGAICPTSRVVITESTRRCLLQAVSPFSYRLPITCMQVCLLCCTFQISHCYVSWFDKYMHALGFMFLCRLWVILILINTGLADGAYLIMEISTTCSARYSRKGSAAVEASSNTMNRTATASADIGLSSGDGNVASTATLRNKMRRRGAKTAQCDAPGSKRGGRKGLAWDRLWVWLSGGEDFRYGAK